MTAVSVVQVPPTPVGVSRAGPPGKGWVFGEGPPADNVGRIGEMYLDTDPEGFFNAYGPKLGATWAGAQVHPLGAESAAALAAQVAAEAAADLAEGYAAATASDRTAVAGDLTQTNADRAVVAADKAIVIAAKDAAEGAAASAADDAASTYADRAAVAGDRTAVATDAGQVAADRAAVEAAASAASDDATQTAADRVQTGLDRVAAEAAAAAAATFDPSSFYTKAASDSRYATAAQGAKADTAVQPAGLTKAAVGLSNVDNTSDLLKPVSNATQTALDAKADDADIAALDGRVDALEASGAAAYVAKTTNYTVLPADAKAVIGASNSITLALTAAATLGNGFAFSIRNVGTGVITIDPDSAELVDGRSTILVYPGEAFDVVCTGTAWVTKGRVRGLVYLGSTTVGSSVASVDFTLGFNDSEITAVSVFGTSISKASSSRLTARVSKAATFLTTLYQGALQYHSNTTATTQIAWAQFAADAVPVGGAASTASVSFEMHLSSLKGNYPVIRFAFVEDAAAGNTPSAGAHGAGGQGTSGAMDGLRFLCTSGNITGGTFYLYGVRL